MLRYDQQSLQVEGWQVPPVLVQRARAPRRGLRFSLSISFYHAGSKRFYGNTFVSDGLDEVDTSRVGIVSEKWRPTSRGARDEVGTR